MKRLIWTLPMLAIVAGAFTSLLFYRSTTQLLSGLGQVDSPALGHTQSLIFDLNNVADGLKGAVAAADKALLDAATQRAAKFRDDLQALAHVPGHEDAAAAMGRDFDAYLKAALQVAGILINGQAGDVGGRGREFGGFARGVGVVLHLLGDLLHRRGGLLQRRGLLLGAAREVQVADRDLGRRGRDAVGRLAHMADHR